MALDIENAELPGYYFAMLRDYRVVVPGSLRFIHEAPCHGGLTGARPHLVSSAPGSGFSTPLDLGNLILL